MAKITVEGMMVKQLERLELGMKEMNYKMDKLYAEVIPEIKIDTTRSATRLSMIVGGITLVISLAGVAVAWFK